MQDLTKPAVTARWRPILRENTDSPNIVDRACMQETTRAENWAIMAASESLGRRVRVRIQPEIWVKWGARGWNYRRARQQYVTISCPSPEQAQLAIDAILCFAESLNDKWLAPDPSQ